MVKTPVIPFDKVQATARDANASEHPSTKGLIAFNNFGYRFGSQKPGMPAMVVAITAVT